jgi:integrase/recombinase XerD
MPLFRKPFYRAARGTWYVEIRRGRQINLGKERDAAFGRYHELIAEAARARNEVAAAPETTDSGSILVVVLVDQFLDWCQKNRAPDTYRWYKDRLEPFCNAIPATLAVRNLKIFHVQQWVDSLPDLSSGSKRNHCRSIQRAMSWSVRQGYINTSPLAHLEKPPAGRREQTIAAAEYEKILQATKDDAFRDVLVTAWETGARPQELLRVEARHVDRANARWLFPSSESKGGKLPRVVYLTTRAVTITERLMLKHPAGPIFRNTDGVAWTPDAANCRFRRIMQKTGVKCCLYALRHTWMNRLLVSGVDALTVAILAGHRDVSTLARFYQHLSQSPDYLRREVERVAG